MKTLTQTMFILSTWIVFLSSYAQESDHWQTFLAAKTYSDLGSDALKRGAGAEAVKLFKKALKLDPHNCMTRMGLGDAYLMSGEREKASDSYKSAANARHGDDSCKTLSEISLNTL